MKIDPQNLESQIRNPIEFPNQNFRQIGQGVLEL